MARSIAIVWLCVSAIGCEVECTSPLAEFSPTTKADNRLLGVWETKSRKDFNLVMIKPFPDLPGYLGVTACIGEQEKYDLPLVRFYCVEQDGEQFVNLSCGDGWAILRYEVNNDTLTVWSANRDAVAKAVTANEIKGKFVNDPVYKQPRVVLTDTRDKIAQVLLGKNGESALSEKTSLHRIATLKQLDEHLKRNKAENANGPVER